MSRGISIALGVGLVILWLTGRAYGAPAWLAWLDGIAALVAFGLAAVFTAAVRFGAAIAGFLALGLIVLWVVALATHHGMWLGWWDFAFACAFLLLAARALAGWRTAHRPQHA
jgi:hypothetical protein